MGDPVSWNGSMPATRQQGSSPKPQQQSGTDLADILERVLDKGIVIAGDIQINLLDIELLTIKLRLVVASVDRAKEMGIDWWERDPTLSSGHRELEDENRRLRDRLDRLERRGLPGSDEDEDEAELAEEDVDDAEEVDVAQIDDQDEADDAEEAPARQGTSRTRRPSTKRPARRGESRR